MKRGIKSKIVRIMLSISLSSLLMYIVIFQISSYFSADIVERATDQMGRKSSTNSENLLISQSIKDSEQIILKNSELVNSQLNEIAMDLSAIATAITYINDHSDLYMPVMVKSAQELVDQGLSDGRTIHYALGEDVELESVSDELYLMGNILPFMEAINNEKGIITSIYIGDESGFSIGYDENAALKAPHGIVYEARNKSWYTEPKQLNGLYVSPPYSDSFGRGLTVSMATPYYQRGELKGIIGLDVLIEDINQSVLSAQMGGNGYAMLLAEQGRVISAPGLTEENADRSNVFLGTKADEIVSLMNENSSGVSLSEIDGLPVYVLFHKIELNNWYYIAVLDIASIIEGATEVKMVIDEITIDTQNEIANASFYTNIILIGMFVATGIVVIWAANKFSKKISKPILMLNDGVKIISNGDFSNKVEIETGDEIEELGASFNKMTKDLVDHIENLKKVTAEKERIGAELDVATKIQASMLPYIFPAFPDRKEFDIYATMEPAKEVGGDFYDFFLIDQTHLGIVIADVSGKGVPAALFMVITKTLIKNYAQLGMPAAEVFTKSNDQLCEGNDAGMFVTAFMGILEIETGKFDYVNAGHNPPLIKKSDGEFEWIKAPAGFVLAGMEGINYKQQSLMLEPDDVIYLYTDGVTEATNLENELFAESRLQTILNENKESTLTELLGSIKTNIDAFVGAAPQFDDITMLAFEYKGLGKIEVIDLPAQVDQLHTVLDFITGQLEKNQCPMKVMTQINIAVEEIFVNIAHYAYASTPEGVGDVGISFKVEENPACAIIEFSDRGIPYNPMELEDPDLTLSADDRKIGGLGIYMVKKSMDEVAYKYHEGKNVLTIQKRF
ncbi:MULTISPECIES: SpoIIE family protein phosphatase [unclassified Fusibacter]|uniref:SpoIIE family protein phosphatase n=1 Tax=unclassified Fusibacter TaxID=2624464 RepID=UPI001010FACE|nr:MULTISPECIES: SpoIIE family protein phosphatase [unclassified Fusibacter]MCK8058474.1 SpoIIE family protein phosphatase [Fusibacter sp. A2]NPE22758.1 SpoIIE family protein phosphatase [Fusibacter sp. A1]RXV60316.1 HAMP domain-containing protein [Fusibacter sp. A1]